MLVSDCFVKTTLNELENKLTENQLTEFEKNKPLTKFKQKIHTKNLLAANLIQEFLLDKKYFMPVAKSFYRCYYKCSRLIIIKDGEKSMYNDDFKTSMYCNARFCPVCQSIKMSQRILKFETVFNKIENLYFVTLTNKCCAKNAYFLNDEIKRQQKIIRKFTNKFMRKSICNMLTKHETTYRKDGSFHPHFHCIVEGNEMANKLKEYWIKENNKIDKSLCSEAAQNVKKADINSIIEIAKYTTKVFSNKERNEQYKDVVWRKYAEIILAIKGVRIYRTYGKEWKILFKGYDDEKINVKLLKKTTLPVKDGIYEDDKRGSYIMHKDNEVIDIGKSNFDKKYNQRVKNLSSITLKNVENQLIETQHLFLFGKNFYGQILSENYNNST